MQRSLRASIRRNVRAMLKSYLNPSGMNATAARISDVMMRLEQNYGLEHVTREDILYEVKRYAWQLLNQ